MLHGGESDKWISSLKRKKIRLFSIFSSNFHSFRKWCFHHLALLRADWKYVLSSTHCMAYLLRLQNVPSSWSLASVSWLPGKEEPQAHYNWSPERSIRNNVFHWEVQPAPENRCLDFCIQLISWYIPRLCSPRHFCFIHVSLCLGNESEPICETDVFPSIFQFSQMSLLRDRLEHDTILFQPEHLYYCYGMYEPWSCSDLKAGQHQDRYMTILLD